MCGIVGYVGRAHATPILLDGLRRLEYRGYDSAGIAVVDGGRLDTRKCAGRIAGLEKLVKKQPVSGSLGISHTRWATHGKVNDENAHPHFDASGKLALVHNGVIENYQALKAELVRSGDTNFRSDTDTEVCGTDCGARKISSKATCVRFAGRQSHALGYAWQGERRKRASALRRQWQAGVGAQRGDRKLSGVER